MVQGLFLCAVVEEESMKMLKIFFSIFTIFVKKNLPKSRREKSDDFVTLLLFFVKITAIKAGNMLSNSFGPWCQEKGQF